MVSGAGLKWPSGENRKSYQSVPYKSLPGNRHQWPCNASGVRDGRLRLENASSCQGRGIG